MCSGQNRRFQTSLGPVEVFHLSLCQICFLQDRALQARRSEVNRRKVRTDQHCIGEIGIVEPCSH